VELLDVFDFEAYSKLEAALKDMELDSLARKNRADENKELLRPSSKICIYLIRYYFVLPEDDMELESCLALLCIHIAARLLMLADIVLDEHLDSFGKDVL
jgi:hypothetical protein